MLIGVDEAGRGPVMGPMVVAGILAGDDVALKELGVKDSKKLSPKRRETLYRELTGRFKYEVIAVSADDIDALREEMTLNELETRLFAGVISKLVQGVEGATAYLDSADVNEERFGRDVARGVPTPIKIVSRHRADDLYPVVSAASIIAKVTRDREIGRIGKELDRNIGSGYPSDPNTIRFLEAWVMEKGGLPPHTRRSWKTARRILNASKVKSIEDYI